MSTNHPSRYRRRRRIRSIRRVAGLALVVCLAVGGTSLVLHRKQAVPAASAESAQSDPAASSVPEVSSVPESPDASSAAAVSDTTEGAENGLLTAQQAQVLLDDPRMVLVNHTHKLADDYTITTKECGSSTAINKDLQTEAADAFFAMQAAAAKDGVDIRMQSGYRSVAYQTNLYNNKVAQFREKGYSEAEAREKAAAIVNPPGYSEHATGLAADLNAPEHPTLDEGFENTAAFRWLSQHAVEYGFILRYPKEAEAVTEITYEPWHWRYVGPESAALISQSGLCLEDAVAVLQKLAAGQSVTG